MAPIRRALGSSVAPHELREKFWGPTRGVEFEYTGHDIQVQGRALLLCAFAVVSGRTQLTSAGLSGRLNRPHPAARAHRLAMMMAMLMVSEQVDFLVHLSDNAHLSTSVISATVMVCVFASPPSISTRRRITAQHIASNPAHNRSYPRQLDRFEEPTPRPSHENVVSRKRWRSRHGIVSLALSTPHARDGHTRTRKRLTDTALRRRYGEPRVV
jgi:hypothetical protein